MRKLLTSALLALCIALPLSAGTFDQTMTMIRIMEQSDLEYKTELLENAFDSSDRFAGTYASEKLKTTMDGKFAGQSSEAVDAFVKVLVKRLGETNSLEDADLIFTIFKDSDNNQLVRTAAEALGKIGAVQYSDNIIELLENSNTSLKSNFEYEKCYRKKGDSIGYKISSNNRVGCFVVSGTSEQELLNKQALVIANMEVYDMDGNPIMRKDIY